MTPTQLDAKLERMRAILRELKSVAVAFSAGADSTFVLKVAVDTLGANRVVAVTGRSDSLAGAEFEDARALARFVGVEHVVIDTGEFDDENYLANPVNRCYFCKTALYDRMAEFIRRRGLGAVVSGTNVDDQGDFRPGLRAADEHRVRSPAAEAGLTKTDIRALSERFGLPTHDKPSSPCLSSRIPYGEPVTSAKLRMIEAAEIYLHDLGFRECRVRHHANDAARIEVPKDRIGELDEPARSGRLAEQFRAMGYATVTIDPKGFRSGSLNEAIGQDGGNVLVQLRVTAGVQSRVSYPANGRCIHTV